MKKKEETEGEEKERKVKRKIGRGRGEEGGESRRRAIEQNNNDTGTLISFMETFFLTTFIATAQISGSW